MNLFHDSREELTQGKFAKEGHLTNYQIVILAESISASAMEKIALAYLGVDFDEVQNLKREHRDVEGFNRAMIRKWAYRNPGANQVKV